MPARRLSDLFRVAQRKALRRQILVRPNLELLEDRTAPALVAAYSFNEGAGTTVADASGNANAGSIASATWSAAGKYGAALKFNGTSARVNINDSNSLHLSSAMTLEAWVNPTVTTSWRNVILKERPGGLAYGLYSSNNPNPGVFISTSAAADQGPMANSTLAKNAWTYLAGTYDGSTMRLYVNGVLAGSSAVSGSILASTGALRIGGNAVWGEYFSGLIDEVRIYNVALTQAQIQTDMNTPIGAVSDTQPPIAPSNLTATAVSTTQINLSWTASTDNVGVTNYLIERSQGAGSTSFSQIATTTGTTFSNTGLTVGTVYNYRVRATDAAGNLSAYSATATATTSDTQAPTTPSNLAATPVSTTQINLSWTASTDNVGVTNYLIERSQGAGSTSFSQIATTTGTTFSNTGLTAGTVYNYQVRATDAAGNLSAYSATATATTPAPDTIPPTVAMTAPADGTTVTGTVILSADASDDVGVAGVQFLLDGATLGAEDTVAPYTVSWNTATASRGTHTLSARARDAAGNLTTSATVSVNVVPQLVITAPANNTSITGPNIAVTYTSTGDLTGVDHAQFTLDGNPQLYEDFDFNGSLSISNVAPGPHTLNGVLVATNRSPIAGTDALAINFTVTASDTTPPTVNMTAPADGALVAGTVTLNANASDNVGVVGVQFLLDGVAVGPEDTSAPYSYSWNSSSVANGSHTLSARARDAAANSTVSTAITVNVTNANDPAAVGQWSSVMNWPLVAINMVLLKNGKILMWDGGPNCIGNESTRVWDPATGIFTATPVPDPALAKDIFCTGMTVLADGRVMIVGGHECNDPNFVGQEYAYMFNPDTLQWTNLPDMTYLRYYPTATTLPDGRVLVTSGSDRTVNSYDPIPEVYDPITNTWTVLSGASQNIANYPFMFVLPNGKVLAAGSDEMTMATSMLDVNTQTWTVVDPRLLDGGSAVMYQPGKIMKAGSSYRTPDSLNVGPSAATTYFIDMNQASPAWQQTSSMAYARTHLNLTVLPDGNVLAIGGSSQIDGFYASEAVLPAEMWSPVTQTWSTMASEKTPRMYHSSALLLPDGRVLSAGGGRNGVTTADYLNAEIYSPSYLFKGARPTITSAPTTLGFNSNFFIATPDAADIASVALIQNGADTHANNMDQRFIPLSFTQGAGGLNVLSPADNNVAPPGYYMLFIINKNGVPSIAPFVRLPAPSEDTQAPSAPSNLSGTGSTGSASLSWTAATDNTGVVRYNVYRSTISGFAPSVANRIAQPTTTSYVDTGLAAGSYYYRVTAQDVAGNVGAPSNEASVAVLGDTTFPTVNITAPTDGSTVFGSISISANAADNVAVAGVTFFLDGNILGTEDTTAPYSITWDTTSATNGNHVLTARARDASGNATTSAGVNITVTNVQPTGLVLAMGFNEGSGTTTTDSSGFANNGTLSNTTWTTGGKFGGALSFNGSSSRVTIADANSLDLTTSMTLEAWVNPARTDSWRNVILKARPGEMTYGLYSSNSPNPGVFISTAQADDLGPMASSVLPTNVWTHLAGTYDGATMKLYINGALAASTAVSGSALISTGALTIGSNAVWGEYFQGLIDEVRIYNIALSQAQIQADMNAAVGASQSAQSFGAASVPQATLVSTADAVNPRLAALIFSRMQQASPASNLAHGPSLASSVEQFPIPPVTLAKPAGVTVKAATGAARLQPVSLEQLRANDVLFSMGDLVLDSFPGRR
ncbi:MAG: fibronectin type III domain-containing protein [Planctomycetes bacterium]|nr:fibronectin type III domain-containing protein [Planctomycetota bacterium]